MNIIIKSKVTFAEINFGDVFGDMENTIYMKIPPIVTKEGENLGNAINMRNGQIDNFGDGASITPYKNAILTL